MICKDISHKNRQRRRAADRRRTSQGLPPRSPLTGRQIEAHLRACTQYIVNIDGKTITIQVEKLEHSVPLATYALNAEVTVDDPLEMKPGEKVDCFGSRNLDGTDVGAWQRQMAATIAMCPGVYDPLDHYLLSWQADEEPTPEQLERAIDVVLHVMGLSEHQTVYGSHINTANYHLHIAVNRVHPVTFELVQPGGGRQIYALHQATAIIEHEQGWKRNEKALFIADDYGVVHRASGVRVRDAESAINYVPKAQRREIEDTARVFGAVTETLSNDAKQYEHRTGTWSLERRAKMIAGPIIKGARSAAEMHEELADHGLGYERRGSGSGAVLTMGGQAVPATTAGRHASIANLEKVWGSGTYTEREPGPANEPSTPPELRIEEYKIPAHYRDEKLRRQRAREVRKAEIVESCDAALRAVDDQAAAHRAQIERHDWSGRGDELNVARAVVSAGRTTACDAVAAVRSEALSNLKASSAFPPFANWAPWLPLPPFDQVAASQSAALVSRSHDTPAVPIRLPHYVGVQIGRECHYHDARGRVAFRDLGPIILIDQATDPDVVKDALRLACAKWGGEHIVPTGDRAFLMLVAQAAVDLKIDIKDATVAKEMKRLRAADAIDAERERLKKVAVQSEVVQRAGAIISQPKMPPRSAKDLSPVPPATINTRAISPEASRPASAISKSSAAQIRELEETQGLRELHGVSPLLDNWVEARLSDPANTALHRALAFTIMQDDFGRQFQEALAAEGFAVGPVIAAQARMYSPSSRPSGPETGSAVLSVDEKPRDAFDGLFVTPRFRSSLEQTKILSSLHRRFNSDDWEPSEYQPTVCGDVHRASTEPDIRKPPSINPSEEDIPDAQRVAQNVSDRLANAAYLETRSL